MLGEVEQVCDRVAVVDRGRVVASGPPAALLGEPEIRVQLAGPLSPAVTAAAARRRLRADGDRVIGVVPASDVPDIVAELVAAGGRITGVEQRRESLDEAFRRLVARSPETADAGPEVARA